MTPTRFALLLTFSFAVHGLAWADLEAKRVPIERQRCVNAGVLWSPACAGMTVLGYLLRSAP
jgi:hypothetical protein